MKAKKLLHEIKRCRINYLYLLPYFILFFIFTVLPVILAICLSFTKYNMLMPAQFAGFDNYLKLFFSDEIFLKSALNTIEMAVIVGPVGYMISFLLAWMITDLQRHLRAFMVMLIYVPSISGNMYAIWKLIFSDDGNGYLNSILMYLGLTNEPVLFLTNTKYMMTIVILCTLWMSMGTGFLSFVAGLQGVDNSQLEAGSVDGVSNRWQELWFIILPSMKPQLIFGAVMSITGSLAIGDVTVALCGQPSTDYAVNTILNHITDYGYTRFDMGYASAMATLLFIIMIVSNKAFQRLMRNIGS